MATIGNLAVMLSANASQLSSGLAGAQNAIQGFASSLKSMVAGGIVGGVLVGVEKSIQGMIDVAKETSARMLDLKANAIKAGTSMQEMAGIEAFARGKTEELVHGLQHLNITLGEIKNGSLEAAKGLQQIGIDPDKLMKLDSFKRLRAILAEYEKLPDEMQKAAFAKEVFKKTGVDLAPVLEKGVGGLDLAAAQTEAVNSLLGIRPDEIAQNAKRLKAFGGRIDALWSGITTKLGANVLDMGATALDLTGLDNKGSAVLGALGLRGKRPVEDIAARKYPDQEKFLKHFDALQSSGANDWLRTHKQLLIELTKAWHNATISTTDYDMQLKKLQETFSKTQIVQAGKLFAETRMPLEQFGEQLDQLNDLFQRGSINQDLYARGLGKTLNAFDKGVGKTYLPEFLSVMGPDGGRKAQQAIKEYEFGGGGGPESFQERLQRVQERLLAEAAESRRYLQEIKDAIKDGKPLQPANLGQ